MATGDCRQNPSLPLSAGMGTEKAKREKDVVGFSKNILYVNTRVATKEQLETSLRSAIEQATTLVGHPIPGEYEVNVVTKRGTMLVEGRVLEYQQNCGYGYIWFSHPLMFNLLLGRNPDGTERYKEIVDPTWIPPQKTETKKLPKSMSWADIVEDEESELPKTIKEYLKPEVELAKYRYTEAQRSQIRESLLEKMKASATVDENDSNTLGVPEYGTFEISPARIEQPRDQGLLYLNILSGVKIPPAITDADLKRVFSRFASDKTTTHIHKNRGREIKDTYPFVTINHKRIAFVTFDPIYHDAHQALMMTRKFQVTKNGVSYTLIFDYARKFPPRR